MKFGVFYEHQLPRPWKDGWGGTEHTHFQNALEQVSLADKLGYDYAWQVEHHFTEEYSHGSAPEVFLAAASQRTERIRLGHGVVQLTTNQPHRVAEKISTLDLVSNGRVEFGVGEASTRTELHPFGRRFRDKREVFEEALKAILPMFTEQSWEFHGEYFDFPARNVLPKPVQKPHPPLWLACSNITTIEYAARMGMGALAFQFVDPENARAWVHKYYRTIRGPLTQLIPHPINPNIAMVAGFMCCETDEEAQAKADGWTFFAFSLAYYGKNDYPEPGTVDMWALYEEWKEERRLAGKPPTAGLIGSPNTIRESLRGYADAGVDQVILLNQAGKNKHVDICESLELFAREVMPEFHAREAEQSAWKQSVLAGHTELEDLDTSGVDHYVVQPPDQVRPDMKLLKAELDARERGPGRGRSRRPGDAMTVLDNGAAGDGALAPDATDLARRWRESVEANDMDAFGSLYTPDATVFTNLEGVSHPLAEHLSRVSRSRGASSSWAYSDVRCQRTETGFVSEHSVRVWTEDGEFVTAAAIVGRVRDGRIAQLSEYLTKPRRA